LKSGEGACPFNPLYWHFLIENREHLQGNPRMGMPYRTLDAMSEEKRATILREAGTFLDALERPTPAPQAPQGSLDL
jgi:deoxyribodipyrimidine photolyase-related protein